jgi:DNA polymerase-1
MGRVRRLPEITSGDHMVKAEAERQAKNSPIQGLASDMNNHFMVVTIKRAKKLGINCYPMATIHDANLIQVEEGKVKKMIKLMRHVVDTAFPDFKCKMVLDFEIGKTLGTLKEVE